MGHSWRSVLRRLTTGLTHTMVCSKEPPSVPQEVGQAVGVSAFLGPWGSWLSSWYKSTRPKADLKD